MSSYLVKVDGSWMKIDSLYYPEKTTSIIECSPEGKVASDYVISVDEKTAVFDPIKMSTRISAETAAKATDDALKAAETIAREDIKRRISLYINELSQMNIDGIKSLEDSVKILNNLRSMLMNISDDMSEMAKRLL
jgi:predicted solute-binding protein